MPGLVRHAPSMTRRSRTPLLALCLFACCGCQPSSATLEPAAKGAPATIAGQLALAGELAGARRGTLTLSAWREGEAGRDGAQPYLSRTYEVDDPDWTESSGALVRYFGLCDADRVGDPARALPDELEIEACFDPDGVPGTREGVVRSSAHARNGEKDVHISVSPKTETAQPQRSREKGG
jgi:hypothetical protein